MLLLPRLVALARLAPVPELHARLAFSGFSEIHGIGTTYHGIGDSMVGAVRMMGRGKRAPHRNPQEKVPCCTFLLWAAQLSW